MQTPGIVEKTLLILFIIYYDIKTKTSKEYFGKIKK